MGHQGQSMSDTRQRVKRSELNPQHGEGLGCACSPGARRDGWDPGGIGGQKNVHFLGRSFPKHIPSFYPSSSGALGPMPSGPCVMLSQPPNAQPLSSLLCAALRSSPFIPPQHPWKRVFSAPQYSWLYIFQSERAPQRRSTSQGCTASLPGVLCTGQDLGSRHWVPSAGQGLGRAVGTPPELQLSPRCNNSPGLCLSRAARAAHAALSRAGCL